MALVPLYDENASNGSSHHMRAPGGYEVWKLVTFDAERDLLFTASLWNGCLIDPLYIGAYRKYFRNPTTNHPPVPGEFACQEVALYRSGRLVASAFVRVPAIEVFPTITDIAACMVGRCQPVFYRVHEAKFLELEMLRSMRWILANPHVRIVGRLDLGGEPIFTTSVGCHERRYGASPLTVSEWMEGCVVFAEHALLFHTTSTTSWLVESTQTGMQLIESPIECNNIARGSWFIGYPRSIALASSATLTNPRVIDHSPVRLRLVYDAKTADQAGQAFVEVFRPTRMNNPLLRYFVPHPVSGKPPITWLTIPPADKSSPSGP